MNMLRLIWDNGTPSCLPRWARDELVQRRLGEIDLRQRNADLREELVRAQGADQLTAMSAGMEELTHGRNQDELEQCYLKDGTPAVGLWRKVKREEEE